MVGAYHGIFQNQGFSIAVAICIGVAGILLLALYFIMITRRDMQYWKNQSQAKVTVLGKIDGRLENMEELMKKPKVQILAKRSAQDHLKEKTEETAHNGEIEADRQQSLHCTVGKSGKVYTQEEIELQIRD